VVNREREATPETPTWNVVIVTTGIARRWFQDGLITARDTLVVDEIHQTSRKWSCVWRSASARVAGSSGCRRRWTRAFTSSTSPRRGARDPGLRPRAGGGGTRPSAASPGVLERSFIQRVIAECRGVAVFVPTRAEVEAIAGELGDRWPASPPRSIMAASRSGDSPFLDGAVKRPFLLAMTAAGQSALNIRGLDTVVIYDARYANVVERGKNVLTRLYLGANEILQMAGRVHGRVEGAKSTSCPTATWCSTNCARRRRSSSWRETPSGSRSHARPLAWMRRTSSFPFRSTGERIARQCNSSPSVDSSRRTAHIVWSRGRGHAGRAALGELLVHADNDLVPMVAVAANIESLHRMTREERDLKGLILPGSDHLTAYNVYAEAVNKHGYLGEVYGLPRHLFRETIDQWRRGAACWSRPSKTLPWHRVGLPAARAAPPREAAIRPRADLVRVC